MACGLGGCATGIPAWHHPPPALSVAELRELEKPDAEDRLEIQVLDEAELCGDYPISAAGDIEFPFCGRVSVADKTPAEICDRIRRCLADGYIRDPQVSVVRKDSGRRISVVGAVHKPGSYAWQSGMTLMQALLLVGGLSEIADPRVHISRAGNEYDVSLDAITTGQAADVVLLPGDRLAVSERIL